MIDTTRECKIRLFMFFFRNLGNAAMSKKTFCLLLKQMRLVVFVLKCYTTFYLLLSRYGSWSLNKCRFVLRFYTTFYLFLKQIRDAVTLKQFAAQYFFPSGPVSRFLRIFFFRLKKTADFSKFVHDGYLHCESHAARGKKK